jgi:Flp pilus assembly protein TadD
MSSPGKAGTAFDSASRCRSVRFVCAPFDFIRTTHLIRVIRAAIRIAALSLIAGSLATVAISQAKPTTTATTGSVNGPVTMSAGPGSATGMSGTSCTSAMMVFSGACSPSAGLNPDGSIFGNSSLMAPDTTAIIEAESCATWTEAGLRSPTVSALRLEVPQKASSEYQKACGAYKDKRFSQAEDHVRKAIEIDPKYAAAWVVLGQSLVAQKKPDDARKACSQAMAVDPTYVPPYICLADLSAKEKDWVEVSRMATQALALDPVSDLYAFYYGAAGAFNLHNLPIAVVDAQAAAKLDTWHHFPELYLLLARIYQAEGDLHNEVTQLKQYLKLAPDSEESAATRTMLAQLQTQLAK